MEAGRCGVGFGPHQVDLGFRCPISRLAQSHISIRIEWQLLDRGSDLPRDIAGPRAVVGQERRRVASALGLEALR